MDNINGAWSKLVHYIDSGGYNETWSTNNDEVIAASFRRLYNEHRVSDSEWIWIEQIGEICKCDFVEVMITPEMDAVTLSVRCHLEEYKITFRWVPDFPSNSPLFESSIKSCFHLNWSKESSLLSAYGEFCETCFRFDSVLSECFNITTPFLLERWDVDNEETGCIKLHLSVAYIDQNCLADEFTLEMYIDVNEPNSFPRSIRCSKPEQLNVVSCQNWDPLETFDVNLHKSFFPERFV